MTRAITAALVTFGAIIIFAGGWSASDIYSGHRRGSFAQRQHCSVLADRYIRREQEKIGATAALALGSVGYSGSHDTCVAEVTAFYAPPAPAGRMISIYDLLSQSPLFSDICSGQPCSSKDDERMLSNADQAFNRLVRH